MKYHPTLNNILDTSKIPNELGFFKKAVTGVLNQIYYKSFYFRKNDDGSSGLYKVNILIPRLDMDVGGFSIIVNPEKQLPDNATDSDYVEIPVGFAYNWEILKYLKAFNPDNFSFSADTVFDILLNVFHTSNSWLTTRILETIYGNEAEPLDAFVADINNEYSSSVGYTSDYNVNPDAAVNEMLTSFAASNITDSFYTVVFNICISDSINEIALAKLEDIFYEWMNGTIEHTINRIVKPSLGIELEVSLGIEVPRSFLKPMQQDTSGIYEIVDEYPANPGFPKTGFLFGSSPVKYSTESGLEFKSVATLDMDPYDRAQIGDSPFNVSFSNAMFRMTEKSDGSGDKRNTISVESAIIGLPALWEDSGGTNPSIYGNDLIIDSEYGFSGKIGIDPGNSLSYSFANELSVVLNSFEITFVEDEVVSSNVTGTLTVPSFDSPLYSATP